jgi:hypothetical protein
MTIRFFKQNIATDGSNYSNQEKNVHQPCERFTSHRYAVKQSILDFPCLLSPSDTLFTPQVFKEKAECDLHAFLRDICDDVVGTVPAVGIVVGTAAPDINGFDSSLFEGTVVDD